MFGPRADRVRASLAPVVLACLTTCLTGGCIRYDVPEQPDLSELLEAYAHPDARVDPWVVHEAAGSTRLVERVAWAVYGLDLPGALDHALDGLDPLVDSAAPSQGEGGGSLSMAGISVGGSGSVRLVQACDHPDGLEPGGVHAVLSLRDTSILSVTSGRFVQCEASGRLFPGEDPGSRPPLSVRLQGEFAADLGGPIVLGEQLRDRWLTFSFEGRVEVADDMAVEEPMDFQTGPRRVAVRIAHPDGGHVIKVLFGGVPRFSLVDAEGVYECQAEARSCVGPRGTFSW